MGSMSWLRSGAWICDFSSTHSTMARSGRATLRPTTSRTLATKSGSVESLKVSSRCELQAEGAPYPLPWRLTALSGHAARTPMGGVGRFGLKGADDHCLNPGILDGARRPGSRLVPKSFKPMLGEAPPPLANRVGIDSQTGSHNLALLAVSTGQNDPGAQRQGLRCAPARRQRRQLSAFLLIQLDGAKASTIFNPPQKPESAIIESIWESAKKLRFQDTQSVSRFN